MRLILCILAWFSVPLSAQDLPEEPASPVLPENFDPASPLVIHPEKEPSRSGLSVSFGLPHLWNIGVETQLGHGLQVGVEGGRNKLRFDQMDVTLGQIALSFRRKTDSAFFWGLLAGGQSLTITSCDPSADGLCNDETVTSSFLTPHFGWQWSLAWGFSVAQDLGLQFPIVSRRDDDHPHDDWDDEKRHHLRQTLGERALPTITILRVHWNF